MKPMKLERTVAAPASGVWEILTDLDRATASIPAIDRIERLDGGTGFDVGTRWRETRTIFGREATEELEVTAVDPGRSYVVEANSRGAHYRSELGVEPLETVRSRLWMTFEAEAEGWIGRIIAATIGRLFMATTRKLLEEDLAAIARAAEAQPAPGRDPDRAAAS